MNAYLANTSAIDIVPYGSELHTPHAQQELYRKS